MKTKKIIIFSVISVTVIGLFIFGYISLSKKEQIIIDLPGFKEKLVYSCSYSDKNMQGRFNDTDITVRYYINYNKNNILTQIKIFVLYKFSDIDKYNTAKEQLEKLGIDNTYDDTNMILSELTSTEDYSNNLTMNVNDYIETLKSNNYSCE